MHPPSSTSATRPPKYSPSTTNPFASVAQTKVEREALGELKKLAEHKRIVNALMDRQGCVLVSAERRAAFLGDEEFEDVVGEGFE